MAFALAVAVVSIVCCCFLYDLGFAFSDREEKIAAVVKASPNLQQ